MGTEQKNLDVPLKGTGQTVYASTSRTGMKWAAVKPVPSGGDVKHYDDAIRAAGRVTRRVIPDPARPAAGSSARHRRHRRYLVRAGGAALDRMPIR
jgi:hypothetical protein